MYLITPRNNYVVVEPVEMAKSDKQERAFILPDEMQQVDPYTIVRVKESANGSYVRGTLLLVPTQILEKAQIGSQTAYFVTENYIIGIVTAMEE